jgi:hypothetical protein
MKHNKQATMLAQQIQTLQGRSQMVSDAFASKNNEKIWIYPNYCVFLPTKFENDEL